MRQTSAATRAAAGRNAGRRAGLGAGRRRRSRSQRPRLIRPSDASGAEEPPTRSPRDTTQRFRRGLLVHALLARLPEIAPEKRREIALKYLKARGDAEDAEAIADETLRVLNDPVFAAAFAPGSRAEAGLVADLPELGPGARINGRIDRLAVTDDEVLIVDFKTNRPPPASRRRAAANLQDANGPLSRGGIEDLSGPPNRLRAGVDGRPAA